MSPSRTITNTDGRKICVTKQEVGDNGQIEQKTECKIIMPGLGRGRRGDDAAHLQELLKEKGFLQIGSSTTGFFGPATLNAIKRLQEKLGLPATGFVGPQTLDRLEKEGGN